VTASGDGDALLQLGGGTLTGVAAPNGADPKLGATGGNGATQGVAASAGSDAILTATDGSGPISGAAATDTGTMFGAAAVRVCTLLGAEMGEGSVAGAAGGRAMGFVAAGAFARISGALHKAASASQVAVMVTATRVVTSIPQPSTRRG
jgi:hypothetical protein